jgi:putative membrane-bound dehydrogenase-like protein
MPVIVGFAQVARTMKLAAVLCVLMLPTMAVLRAADVRPAAALPVVPPGFSIELAAGPPLVTRPIAATFDEVGRLYVTESSGSNDPVAKQLELRPHRVVRLEDSDGDGKFERSAIFADRLMLPQGALFWRGSLYVSAAPSIWKLTDTDGDGVADERVEWFQGKTLTGCANDLHGPYLGPDGWLYWCKGAFAEQTHTVHGREFKSRAAHVFRSRPDGSGLEPVITGGMDNPVGLAFTPEGERILSATYLSVNPRIDGLVHAVYGAVYGKMHGVLEGHPRTGELMPTLVPMSPAAPCGVARYDSDVFGAEFRDNLFACQFNLRKVSRHVLRPAGSTFTTQDSDFVVSDDVDFHPTDVLADADGSLLVIDTGGWYKLCCPTSTLWKPDVLGGIYRVRKNGAKSPADPRGRQVAWPRQTLKQLWALHADSRPAVRQRASVEFVRRVDAPEMDDFLRGRRREVLLRAEGKISDGEIPAVAYLWTLSQLGTPEARGLIRDFYSTDSDRIRHTVLQAVNLQRDPHILEHGLMTYALNDPSPANRRVVIELFGRLGEQWAVPHILAAADNADDRVLQHAVIYALIELADPIATRRGLAAKSPETIAAALIALDQMPGGDVKPADVIEHLSAANGELRRAARWVMAQHPEWGSELAEWFRDQLAALPERPRAETERASERNLEAMLVGFCSHPAIQQLLADTVSQPAASPSARLVALRVMASAKLHKPPAEWGTAAADAILHATTGQLSVVLSAARNVCSASPPDKSLRDALLEVAGNPAYPLVLRVDALAIAADGLAGLSDEQFQLLMTGLTSEDSLPLRTAAADAISKSHLSASQLDRVCKTIQTAGPLELNRLLGPFERTTDEQIGLKLLSSLKQASALPSLRIDLVRLALAKYGPAVQKGIDEIESLVNVDAAAQRKRLEELLPLVTKGDVRRGHAVFYHPKAACAACHRLGNAGGTAGPDLTHIGESRTERDLLESILYPSLSFVRSYEPVVITTTDGQVISGNIRDETAKEYVVATGADQEVRVVRDEVEQIEPGTVSIMPAGLDQQLSLEQLADLIAFLKNKNAAAQADQ